MSRTKLALPIVGSVAVVAAVVGVLWAMGSASGERDRFSSLEIAPAEADVFFAINTDPTSPQWLAVNDSLDKVNAKDPIREFIDEALAEVNLDWEDDITPIAGDEAFFSVPDIEDVSDGGGFVAGFRIRNTDRAERVFEDLRGEAEDNGEEFEEEEYEGVTIYFTEPTDIGGIDPFGTSSEDPFADDPFFDCIELDFDGATVDEVPDECVPHYECADYGMGTTEDDDDTDLDGNGSPDSCDATFDSQPSFGTEASISAGGAVALFDDVLTLGGTPDDVKAVIDVVQGREESAETNERLQEFRALQKDDFLMWGYVDLAPVWDLAEENLPPRADTSDPDCAPAGPGVTACPAATPDLPPDLAAISDYIEYETDGDVNISIVLPLHEPAEAADRIGFYTYDGDGGWSRAAEVTLQDDGTLAQADFRPLPGNLVVLRDDSEPRVTQAPTGSTEPDKDIRVTSFEAEYAVADGLLQVTERIAVDFGGVPKHGIFRDIPESYDFDFESDARLYLAGQTTVLRDGVAEPFEVIANTPDDFARIRIGDPNVEITGVHTYEVRYAVQGAIRQLSDEPFPYYEIVWDVTGDRWPVPIETASAAFTSAEGVIVYASCFLGEEPTGIFNIALDADCNIEQSEDDLSVALQPIRPIEPGEGIGLLIGVEAASGAPDPELIPDDNFGDFPFEDDDIFEPETDPLEELPFDLAEVIDNARGAFDRVGFTISSHSNAFALDFTVLQEPGYAGDFDWEASDGFESHFASEVPDDTMFFFAGDDLYEQGFAQFRQQLDALDDEQRQAWDDVVETVSDEIGVDLEDDVLALLTGEIAFAGNLTDFGSGGPDVELRAMADVSDDADATDTLETIGEYLEDQGFIEIDEDDGLTRWVDAETGDIEVGWRVEDGRLVFGFPADAAEGATAGDGDSLADTDDWKRTLDLLPEESAFVGYLSIARILEEVAGTNGEGDPIEEFTSGEVSLDDLDAIRTAAFSATIREDGFGYHFVLFMED